MSKESITSFASVILFLFNWPYMNFVNHTNVSVLNKETFVEYQLKKLTFLYLLQKTALEYFSTIITINYR